MNLCVVNNVTSLEPYQWYAHRSAYLQDRLHIHSVCSTYRGFMTLVFYTSLQSA